MGQSIKNEDEFYKKIYKNVNAQNVKKLKMAHVAIMGLGGLGSNVAAMLCRAGISSFHLVDFDDVEYTNLNRQIYKMRHVNMAKTDAMTEILTEINPFCKIQADKIKINEKNVGDIFKSDEIIIEALDDAKTKAMVINALCDSKKIIASSGIAGYGASNEVKTRKINENLYIAGDFHSDIKDFDTYAPKVALVAAHQANIAIATILG